MIPADLKKDIVKTLKTLNPEKIILFGSHAYGKPNDDSDIDLLIIKKIPEKKVRDYRIQAKKLLWEKFKQQNLHFDIIVDSQERINERINIGDLFYEEIYNKGQIIYA